MPSRLSAGWDIIDSRPRRFVMAIGSDGIPTIHNCDGCAVTQCKLARSLFEKGEVVRMIDVGPHGHVTIIKVSLEEPAQDAPI